MGTKTTLMEKLAAKIRRMDEAALAASSPVPPEAGRTHAVTFYTTRERANAVASAASEAEVDSKQ